MTERGEDHGRERTHPEDRTGTPEVARPAAAQTSAATILDVLRARAAAKPDALAYAAGDDAATYGQLEADVFRLAAALVQRGLGRDSRCALVLPTGLGFIRALYATQIAGAVPIALQQGAPPELTLKRLRRTGCALALIEGAAGQALRDAAARELPAFPTRFETLDTLWKQAREARTPPRWSEVAAGPDDTAFLQLTSGTSGEPRAAVLLHRNLLAALESGRRLLEIRDRDVLVGWVPLYHDLGLVRFVFSPLYFGCPVHLLAPSLANLKAWLETAARVRATITGGPDFGYRIAARLFDGPGPDLSCLRHATDGGEAVRSSTIEAFESRFGVSGVIRPGYGLAEATLGVSGLRAGEPLRHNPDGSVSCGQPLHGVEVKIAAPDGATLPAGQLGEILVRGPSVFAGYLHEEAATRQALRGGWLHTGDVGELDADGHLYVLGRQRAIIKRGGALLAPREVEEAADQVEGVRFSAALGEPSEPDLGLEDLVLVAEIHPEIGSNEAGREALRTALRGRVLQSVGIAPARILLVPPRAIPRTQNGKIRYEALRELLKQDRLPRH